MSLWVWIGVGAAAVTLILFVLWRIHHTRRKDVYRQLADRRRQVVVEHSPILQSRTSVHTLAETFRDGLLVRDESFLTVSSLKKLQHECMEKISHGTRSYIPFHKKGRTLSYENLHHYTPACLAFYHSEAMLKWVEGIVGERVYPAGDHDQSAASILYYDQAGDHINWHFDHNYYHGRQFTVLLSLVNKSADAELSASRYMYRNKAGEGVEVDTSENSIVIFEGEYIHHKATPVKEGDLRVMLSMTYNTQPRIHPLWEFLRRCKDIAFYGLRVLWD